MVVVLNTKVHIIVDLTVSYRSFDILGGFGVLGALTLVAGVLTLFMTAVKLSLIVGSKVGFVVGFSLIILSARRVALDVLLEHGWRLDINLVVLLNHCWILYEIC
jgi:uncharacterized membrane-anchored protein